MGTQTKTNNAVANNPRTKEFVSEQGNTYIFQRVTPSKWLKILDESEAGGTRSRTKLYPAILGNVVVQPGGLSVDDFDKEVYEEGEPVRGGFSELDEVVTAAIRFQQGKQ